MNENESGYIVYLQDTPKLQFYFDKSLNRNHIEVSQNINTTKFVLNTFGKYPYVYNVGNMNYKTFDLTGIFLATENDDGVKILTASEHAKQFEDMVNSRKPFVVENSKKEKFLCDVKINSISAPMLYYENDMEYVTVNISCTEIGSV